MPAIWLISDARNDTSLERTLRRLPRGSGFVFRHYHLGPGQRRARFGRLAKLARKRGHIVALAGPPELARCWGADAVYGSPRCVAGAYGLMRIATVHCLRELGAANRARADIVMISPLHATRSHPGGRTLGPVRAMLLARHTAADCVMLGGMNAHRARRIAPHGWAAIDGLSP